LLTKAKKSWENLYFSYNIFFGPLLSKIGGHTAATFSRPIIFYSAGFVLFGRIFSQLATVSVGPLPQTTPSGVCWPAFQSNI
jgi:hypothetical protein